MRLTFSCWGNSWKLAGATLAGVVLVVGLNARGIADDNDKRNDDRKNEKIIYSSIAKPLPGNVASEGPEAYAFREIGDGLVFVPGAGGIIDDVKVVLSSWGCVTGHWYSGDCVTEPKNATFSQPITLKVYAVMDIGGVPTPQQPPLATVTKTFDIPYRPSSNPAKCPADANGFSTWFNEKDKTCYHGLAVPISFDLTSQGITVPNRIIVGITYNTSHYGYAPIGQAVPCYTSSGGCPYDSLNVSTDGSPRIGSSIDPNGIYLNGIFNAQNNCPGYVDNGTLHLDTPCWTGFHPQIEVTSKARKRPHRDNDPTD